MNHRIGISDQPLSIASIDLPSLRKHKLKSLHATTSDSTDLDSHINPHNDNFFTWLKRREAKNAIQEPYHLHLESIHVPAKVQPSHLSLP